MTNGNLHQPDQLNNIESLIIEVRNQKVLLDSDVATVYGVETKRINEAVQRNKDKFPDGYILSLDKKEWELLKSHFATSIDKESKSLQSQNVISKGGKVKLPKALSKSLDF